MDQRLTREEVRKVAELARLKLSDREIEEYRGQLSSVLDHIAKLQLLDVGGVEPMAHPGDLTNRLDDDRVEPPMDAARVLAMAPESQGPFISVPKVLPGDESA